MNFILRKWRAEDSADVAHFANNEKIACNLRNVFPYPYTMQDAKNYVEGCASNSEAEQLCRAVTVDGKAVGSIGIFLGSDVYSRSAELGYWLAEEYWNRGIMSAAVKQICEEAFERFDIVRIFAEPFAHNLGSRKVLENGGFALEGIMKNGVFKNGTVFDYCMYALLRPDEH
ncbi:MAG: GNAT family N-acetyltransferase [Oscillospiraceae bacterium]